ncbi:MAG: M24 family metallopeptidase [Gammaproteobacteria bacterium]|nr:M24 family metallopeptidase [Gammaproteobacteria bacterium]NKB65415.1 M24 family metallopeptidase [Gammaproteobacteria bacterium]
MIVPNRGFPESEFATRTHQMQTTMRDQKIDALILTTEPNVRYFSGFFTQFWESPTRPWFLVVPADGKPIAVIPEIGIGGMQQTWIEDIHTWPSPQPEDDGIALLQGVIRGLPKIYGRIGMTLGIESIIRMPVNNFELLKSGLEDFEFVDLSLEMHEQRMVKSELEIEKTRHICGIASDTFEAFSSYAQVGMTETGIVRNMKIDLLNRGADTVSYVVAGSGSGGYDSIIMGPTNREIRHGDLMIIDTGSTFDGYYCDFDRNWAFGQADDATRRAYEVVYHATEAGFKAARPGATTSDLWRAMNDVMVAGGSLGNEVGRLGHGLGIQLTERPSNTATDGTTLKAGMVMTLEPGMTFLPGKQMVHEENIVITEDGAEWLTRRASPELPIV